jgi:AraC-like DNA-binding protein
METVAHLNPPARHLGTVNAVMGSAGVGRHFVSDFTGPLSIKFMVRGSGIWRSDAGVHHVEEGYFLVLNHGQTYSLEIEGHLPRESFCPFFRRGFVEDIHRALTTSTDRLLDDPDAALPPVDFHAHLHPEDARVVPRLLELRDLMYGGAAGSIELEDAFVKLGLALLAHAGSDLSAQINRVPASRSSTRAECHRRVARARDHLHARAHERLTLDDLAAHACLSPYHFHRQFTAIHGLTPQRYLTRLRLERACRLLRDSDLPITRIAQDVGFGSPASFSRRFTSTFGTSPVRHRAELRKNGKAPGAADPAYWRRLTSEWEPSCV